MDVSTHLEKYGQNLINLPSEIKFLMDEMRSKDFELFSARRQYKIKENQLYKFIRLNGSLIKHPKEEQIYNKIEKEMMIVKKLQKEKIILGNTALFLITRQIFNFETDIAILEKKGLMPSIDNTWEQGESRAEDMDFGDCSTMILNPHNDNNKKTVNFENGKEKKVFRRKLNASNKSKNYEIPSIFPITRSIKKVKNEYLNNKKNDSAYNDSKNESNPVIMEGRIEKKKNRSCTIPLNNENVNINKDKSIAVHRDDNDNKVYCFCQKVSYGEMIGCDSVDCDYEWFHLDCVGIVSTPAKDEIWYCSNCLTKNLKKKKTGLKTVIKTLN